MLAPYRALLWFGVSFSILFRFIAPKLEEHRRMGSFPKQTTFRTVITCPLASLSRGRINALSHLYSRRRFQIELLHEQLPLPVPCYDLVLVIEFTVGSHM